MKATIPFFLASSLLAQTFVGAPAGCWMAHCNPQLNDASNVPILARGKFTQIAHDTVPQGSLGLLGCSGNQSVFACSYMTVGNYTGPYMKVYDVDGNVLWTDGGILDGIPGCGAPMVGADGGVIGCDDTQVVRWDPSGNRLWDTCFYSGNAPVCTCPDGVTFPPCSLTAGHNQPTSAVQVANGSIVLATYGNPGHAGPVFNVNSGTGALISSLYLGHSGNDSFITVNTPCVSAPTGPDGGNRVFIITQYSADASRARVYAITVEASRMKVAWVYPPAGHFTGPSGASPLCLQSAANGAGGVFTDGRNSTNSMQGSIWGLNQSTGALLFACDSGPTGTGCPVLPTHAVANFPLDPRGGFWDYSVYGDYYERRSTTTGNVVQSLNIRNIIPGEPCALTPVAATTMSKDPLGNPTLIFGLASNSFCGGGIYTAWADAVTGALQGYFQIGPDVNAPAPGAAHGQFPVVTTPDGKNRIAFSVNNSGMYLIGQ